MTYGVYMGGHAERWRDEKKLWRRGPGTLHRHLQTLRFLATRDRRAVVSFLRRPDRRAARLRLLRRFLWMTGQLRGYHTLAEMLEVVEVILQVPGAVVVEAGVGPGSSTAKLSLAVQEVAGTLHAFDTFRGIPENEEQHHLLDGRPLRFLRGAFRGRLGAVERRLERYGAPGRCTLHKGLFDDRMPPFVDGGACLDVVLLDVDLLESTRTCIRLLYPRLRRGGWLFTQDGHLQATHSLLGSEAFWWEEVGVEPPMIEGLGRRKLLRIRRE